MPLQDYFITTTHTNTELSILIDQIFGILEEEQFITRRPSRQSNRKQRNKNRSRRTRKQRKKRKKRKETNYPLIRIYRYSTDSE